MSFLEFSVEDEIIKLIDFTNLIKRYVVLYFKIWRLKLHITRSRSVFMYYTQGIVAGDSAVTSRRGKRTFPRRSTGNIRLHFEENWAIHPFINHSLSPERGTRLIRLVQINHQGGIHAGKISCMATGPI